YAQALEECVCIGLPMKIAVNQGLNNPEFLRFLCKHLVEKLDSITFKSSMNMLYELEIRLASYLIQSYNKQTSVFVVQSNYADLAELLGTSYRHLNRTLIAMEEKGILQKKGRQITLLKVAELKQLGKEMYE
ncbi:MAG: helix-turn-helix domain-containing protein, partial [Vallitaleaceae bacterium]|nr:helix-turn-helix domain-containing protein [Vallitaleaceae bacterium]